VENPWLDKLSNVPIRVIEGLECSTNSAHDADSLEHYAENYSVKNPDCLSRLVFMTHRHDCSKCSSPRDYVDTKSWLAYEQNPYSIHWVRLDFCHKETSLGYDISLLSLGYKPTRICDFFTMRQHLDALISGVVQPYHSQHDSVTLSPVWLGIYIAPRPSRLDSFVTSMTRHLHRVVVKSPQQRCHQHHHQHDSASLLCHGKVTSVDP
jgi:hypothetical protein